MKEDNNSWCIGQPQQNNKNNIGWRRRYTYIVTCST